MTDEELTKELRARNLRAIELGNDILMLQERVKTILNAVKLLNQKLEFEREKTSEYRKELNG